MDTEEQIAEIDLKFRISTQNGYWFVMIKKEYCLVLQR